MQGQDVVGSDDHKLGTVVDERDGCTVVEMGHVFKSRHAIPDDFLHEFDGVLRATVSREIVEDSPKVEDDGFDVNAVKLHYGLLEVHVVDPDPDERDAETEGVQHGVDPAPSERVATLGGAGDPALEPPEGLDPADSSTFGGIPRTNVSRNDRSTKP
jgi:hypothetical protein